MTKQSVKFNTFCFETAPQTTACHNNCVTVSYIELRGGHSKIFSFCDVNTPRKLATISLWQTNTLCKAAQQADVTCERDANGGDGFRCGRLINKTSIVFIQPPFSTAAVLEWRCGLPAGEKHGDLGSSYCQANMRTRAERAVCRLSSVQRGLLSK